MNGSLLRQVPCQEGDEGRQGHNHEERKTGNPGRMSNLWYEDVQNREIYLGRGSQGGPVVNVKRVRVICPACGQEVEALARDGRVKGYCAVAGKHVDFDTGGDIVPKAPAGRDSKGHFIKGNVPWNAESRNSA